MFFACLGGPYWEKWCLQSLSMAWHHKPQMTQMLFLIYIGDSIALRFQPFKAGVHMIGSEILRSLKTDWKGEKVMEHH